MPALINNEKKTKRTKDQGPSLIPIHIDGECNKNTFTRANLEEEDLFAFLAYRWESFQSDLEINLYICINQTCKCTHTQLLTQTHTHAYIYSHQYRHILIIYI